MKNELQLMPTYWANVSGGKDSLFMLKLILSNLDRYPLNGVVHFELEIDYPFIKNVIDEMERDCKRHGIPFVRIRPRKTWEELFYTVSKTGYIYGFPTRGARWCNNMYKLDAKKQLVEYMNSLGKDVISYIGYCSDETERFNKRKNRKEVYPLVENGILEKNILEWAKTVDIFNNYYLTNRRCGCMYCPLASRMEQAYLYKYYPEQWVYMLEKMRETEQINCERYAREKFSCISGNPKYNANYLEHIIKTKWIHKLEEIEAKEKGCYNGEL